GSNGINLAPSGSASAALSSVQVNNNGQGILVSGLNSTGSNAINATVSDSVAAGNAGAGIYSNTQSGAAPTSVMVFHTVASNNGTGIAANGSGGTLRLANSTVTGNAVGWFVGSPGVVANYGDNYTDGNASTTGTLTSINKQ